MKPWEHLRAQASTVTTEKRHASLEQRVAELLIRHEAGDFPPPVRARLAEIFRDAPADAWERLEKACDYLEISGLEIEEHLPAYFFANRST